jgi:hypothetical protein
MSTRTTEADPSRAWLKAIETATLVLVHEQDISVIQASLDYLLLLEKVLLKRNLDLPPQKYPPGMNQQPARNKSPAKESPRERQISNNPFSVFNEDGDDLSSSSSLSLASDTIVDEAGDEPVLHCMIARRLLVRVLTSQSDIFACLASHGRSQSLWTVAASHCTMAVRKIQAALTLADSEVSKLWDCRESLLEGYDELVEDADIVSVVVRHLTEESSNLLLESKRQQAKIERRLQPQWESRDQVKQRMGNRWFKNPAPKGDFAAMRAKDEAELKEIVKSLKMLDELDAATVVALSQDLKKRLEQLRDDRCASSPNKSPTIQRYNGKRPQYPQDRVSLKQYNDPTAFGWKLTGSNQNSRVEFFEKRLEEILVKLDWYYTTATIKTSMDHPTKGKTQLFASGGSVSPEIYMQILKNPRVHTNIRFQTQKK